MDEPLVSVVMGVYRPTEHLLERSIESILAQTYRRFEFIIVDDGNNAADQTLLKRYGQLDKRVWIIRNEQNMGLTKSLQRGVKCSKGTLVARQDADDSSAPNRLQKQVERFEVDENIGLLGTWYKVTDGEDVKCVCFPNDNEVLKRELMRRNPFCHASTMFRKDIYEQVGGYDDSYKTSQDLDLWCRIANAGYSLGMLESFFVERTLHGGNLSLSRRAWQQVGNSFRIRSKYCKKHGFLGYSQLIWATAYHALATLKASSSLSSLSRHFGSNRDR